MSHLSVPKFKEVFKELRVFLEEKDDRFPKNPVLNSRWRNESYDLRSIPIIRPIQTNGSSSMPDYALSSYHAKVYCEESV